VAQPTRIINNIASDAGNAMERVVMLTSQEKVLWIRRAILMPASFHPAARRTVPFTRKIIGPHYAIFD
jgi:hypothetical protein